MRAGGYGTHATPGAGFSQTPFGQTSSPTDWTPVLKSQACPSATRALQVPAAVSQMA